MTPERLIVCLKSTSKELEEALIYLKEKYLLKFIYKNKRRTRSVPNWKDLAETQFFVEFHKLHKVAVGGLFETERADGKPQNPEAYFQSMLAYAFEALLSRGWYRKNDPYDPNLDDRRVEADSRKEPDDEDLKKKALLDHCKERLNANQRAVIELRYSEPPKTWAEIGSLMVPSQNEGQVKMAHTRAMKKLKQCVGQL